MPKMRSPFFVSLRKSTLNPQLLVSVLSKPRLNRLRYVMESGSPEETAEGESACGEFSHQALSL